MNAPKPTSGDDAALSNLLGAAIGTPETSRPTAQDDTLLRTGNTADHQAGWFAGIEQGQVNAQHNAQVRAQAEQQAYGAPAEVASRIEQYIAHYGRENTAGLLLYEAMKALRAPVSTVEQGDAQDGRKPWECAFETWWEDHGQYCRAGGGQYERSFAYCAYEAALASRPAPAAGDARDALPPLNDDLIEILGRPNFACAELAAVLRAGGHVIKNKSEHEQAAVIHFLLGHYLEHGADWHEHVGAALEAIAAQQGKGGAA